MAIDITLPESGKTYSVKSFTRGQLRKINQMPRDNPAMELAAWWESIITEAIPDIEITDDWATADIAYLAKTIMAYSNGGPDSVKNF